MAVPGVASETIDVVANNGISNSNTAVTTIAISAPPVVELNPPSTNYATSWTNPGAVAITPHSSSMLLSGLNKPTDRDRRVGRGFVGRERWQRHDW